MKDIFSLFLNLVVVLKVINFSSLGLLDYVILILFLIVTILTIFSKRKE